MQFFQAPFISVKPSPSYAWAFLTSLFPCASLLPVFSHPASLALSTPGACFWFLSFHLYQVKHTKWKIQRQDSRGWEHVRSDFGVRGDVIHCVSSSIHLLWISWFHFSLRLSNSALRISTSSSPTPTDGYLGSLHSLAAENRAATNMAKQASPQQESLSGAWLGAGELGHMEVPFLTLWENLHGFPVAVLVPTSTNTVATPVATCSSQPSHSDLKPFLETYL